VQGEETVCSRFMHRSASPDFSAEDAYHSSRQSHERLAMQLSRTKGSSLRISPVVTATADWRNASRPSVRLRPDRDDGAAVVEELDRESAGARVNFHGLDVVRGHQADRVFH
jgi:hypothetical protein